MIKSRKGMVTLKGSGAEITLDLTMTIKAVKEALEENAGKEFATHMVSEAFRLGMMTEKQLHDEAL